MQSYWRVYGLADGVPAVLQIFGARQGAGLAVRRVMAKFICR